MNSRRHHEEVADWQLERFLLGELPPAAMANLERRIDADASLAARLDTLRESNGELLARYPEPWMTRQIENKLAAGRMGWRERLGLAGTWRPRRTLARLAPVAAAAVATVLILPFLMSPETRIKGLEPQLLLYRQTDAGSEQLASGALVHEHDLILVNYQAAGARYGAVLSIDGRGTLTQHLPADGVDAIALEQGEPQALPFAYELDDAPHAETFYFVTSDTPFTIDMVAHAALASMARRAPAAPPASLQLPDPLRQSSFTLSKESSHE